MRKKIITIEPGQVFTCCRRLAGERKGSAFKLGGAGAQDACRNRLFKAVFELTGDRDRYY